MKRFIIVMLLILFSIISGCNMEENKVVENRMDKVQKIENSDFILEQMNKKNSSNEVLEIKNKSDLILEEEIKEANKRFNKLNNSIFSNKNKIIKSKNITKKIIQLKINETSWYKPKPETSWQWQIGNSGNINTKYEVDMYDIDLFDAPQNIINELHKRNIKVICYFSAGSWEKYRDDAKNFPKETLGKTLKGWSDEKWLDILNYNLFSDIMLNRLDLAVEKKCDGIEPDNVDAYQNKNGFNLEFKDQIEYNMWLAEEAHKRNLSIGLKNDLEQIEILEPYFDFAINEQCFEYNECDLLKPFIKNDKAVFGVEYEQKANEFCNKSKEMKFSFLEMTYDLKGERIGCE